MTRRSGGSDETNCCSDEGDEAAAHDCSDAGEFYAVCDSGQCAEMATASQSADFHGRIHAATDRRHRVSARGAAKRAELVQAYSGHLRQLYPRDMDQGRLARQWIRPSIFRLGGLARWASRD